MFNATNQGAKVVRSVLVVCDCGVNVSGAASGAFNPLGQPQRTGVPPPKGNFVQEYFRRSLMNGAVESTAELFVFTNMQLGKRLAVHKWVAKKKRMATARHLSALVDKMQIFLLQITDFK